MLLTIIINNKILYQDKFVKLTVINEEFGPIEIQEGYANCMFEIKDKIIVINKEKTIINIETATIKVEGNKIDIVGTCKP